MKMSWWWWIVVWKSDDWNGEYHDAGVEVLGAHTAIEAAFTVNVGERQVIAVFGPFTTKPDTAYQRG